MPVACAPVTLGFRELPRNVMIQGWQPYSNVQAQLLDAVDVVAR